jgi:nucleoid DNA-binding protein
MYGLIASGIELFNPSTQNRRNADPQTGRRRDPAAYGSRHSHPHQVTHAPVTRMGNCSTLEQMTKQQLVEAVSVKTGREQAEVENVLEAVLGSIADALTSNERVDLRGFGSFAVKDKKERQGRNPRTGETITIAAKRNASFKPGKELSEKLILPKTEANPA